jgi:hypothetical protein
VFLPAQEVGGEIDGVERALVAKSKNASDERPTSRARPVTKTVGDAVRHQCPRTRLPPRRSEPPALRSSRTTACANSDQRTAARSHRAATTAPNTAKIVPTAKRRGYAA